MSGSDQDHPCVVPVLDVRDPRVVDYAGLTDVALRRRDEPERGVYIAESPKVVRRALATGHRPRSFLLSTEWLADSADLLDAAERFGVPVFAAPAERLRELTGFTLHRGAMAAMHRPPVVALADVLAGARRVAVLADLADSTNVGAAFRGAAGLGFDAVLVTPRCADPLYRRAVRVSMGTVFQVPWTRIDPWPGGVGKLQRAGFTVAALALAEGAVPLDELAADPPERLAVVLGAEGDGLGPEVVAGADLVVRIPMAGAVDSLNVAAAAAVAFWALRPPPR